ncbi:MAG: metal ABC transporter substrate-binding protein, partial [Dehalococcoidia bacterium]
TLQPSPWWSRRPIVWLLSTVVILASLLIAGCGDDDTTGAVDASPTVEAGAIPSPAYDWSDEPWSIVVSLPIFADFAREMGGDQVTVTTLIPPGVDPHTYVPPPEAADLIKTADLVFVNGLGLDQPTIDFVQANRPDGPLFMVDFVRNIPSPSTTQPIGGMPIFAKEIGDNPHLYLDPVLVPLYAETVSHSLVIIDGINEPYYDALFANYKQRLKALNEEIATAMGRIPAENRTLVTEHNSMIHWANRYGLTVEGTLEDDGEDGLREILTTQNLAAVFGEIGLGDGTLQDLASESGTPVCVLATDSIEVAGMAYIKMMETNSAALVSCLGG